MPTPAKETPTEPFAFLKKIYTRRFLIAMLAKRNLQMRYAGTTGGLVWSVLNPLLAVAVYWAVFGLGFRVKPAGGAPFILAFLAGFVPWMMFSELANANTSAIVANAPLVKKTVFPSEIFPIANLIAALIPHAFLIALLAAMAAWNHVPFFSSQLFGTAAALIGLCLFSVGLGWLLSALNLFYRDIGQALGAVLNVWFWATPIAWMSEMLPGKWRFLIRLNPLFYVIENYRASFALGSGGGGALSWAYFWTVCFATAGAGAIVFKKLKPEFADVL